MTRTIHTINLPELINNYFKRLKAKEYLIKELVFSGEVSKEDFDEWYRKNELTEEYQTFADSIIHETSK